MSSSEMKRVWYEPDGKNHALFRSGQANLVSASPDRVVDDTFGEFQYSYHYGDMHAPYIRQIEPLRVECQHFLDCIRNDVKSESSGEEGMHVVQILEASSESLKRNGAKVNINNHS